MIRRPREERTGQGENMEGQKKGRKEGQGEGQGWLERQVQDEVEEIHQAFIIPSIYSPAGAEVIVSVHSEEGQRQDKGDEGNLYKVRLKKEMSEVNAAVFKVI